ncbi:MAG: hypothetical protein QM698_13425 [Micropepsaceae bacterium]
MITTHIRPGRRPHVLAIFSFRHDAHLVPDMLVNIAPMVDGWVSYDDRASDALFSNEVQRRVALLNAARDAGAAWALAIDPDERFEAALADEMQALTSQSDCNAVTFALREMYTPAEYRTDGVWGQKRQARLLRVADGVVTPDGDLHLPWTAFIADPRVGDSGLNLYHLKMIAPARRQARAELYNRLDPGRRMQSLGYDYLADEQGAEFETIPPGRSYLPEHRDDGGLWMTPAPLTPQPRRPGALRVLILTNHFADFAGSEMVALETAEWFRDRGDSVTIAANMIGRPICDEIDGVTLTDDVEAVRLEHFDLVWCQHDLLTLLPLASLERASASWMPHVVYVSLSPFEPYEHLNAPLARALSADIFVNSPETRTEMLRRHHGELEGNHIQVFSNAAPAAFHIHRGDPPAARLGHLTLVSNHPPEELLEALEILQTKGVAVRHIGHHGEAQRVTPADLAGTDAVVTIGKTVIYAIALGVPAYVYDHYGGEGWLTPDNLDVQLTHNFSGRPAKRRLSPGALVREIAGGYAAAAAFARNHGAWPDRAPFHLDTHLNALRRRALGGQPPEIAARFHAWLQAPGARAGFEAMHQKALIMKRFYRLANPPR